MYFSDRPARIAGHLSVEELVSGWTYGDDSLADDPPNASLSVLGGKDVVMELDGIARDGDSLTFTVRLIDGTPPGAFGPASLFIDDRSPFPLDC